MDSVHRWTGRETRALRHALRMSMRAFADHLGVALRTVAKWEQRADQIEPRPPVQDLLDAALRLAPEEARQRFFAVLGGSLTDAVDTGDTARADSATIVSFDEQAADLRERLSSAAAVDSHAIGLLATQADRIREVDRMLGAQVAVNQLDGHLSTLELLRAFTVSVTNRELLAGLYSDAAALAGWQRLDQGDLLQAWQRHESAKEAGYEARSPAALVHAMAQQAYVLVELGEANLALQLAEHARIIAGTAVPPLLSAWLVAVQGELQAINGTDCRQAFDQAGTLLPADPSHPDLPYIVLDDVHLARWRGSALARLGDSAAINDLRHALYSLDQSFTRARAGVRVDLAHALAAADQRADAAAELREAQSLALQVGSARQRRRVRQLESVLQAA